ncbi:hypothetical protein LXL04_008235 [Taraxacum kok-saghyz]
MSDLPRNSFSYLQKCHFAAFKEFRRAPSLRNCLRSADLWPIWGIPVPLAYMSTLGYSNTSTGEYHHDHQPPPLVVVFYHRERTTSSSALATAIFFSLSRFLPVSVCLSWKQVLNLAYLRQSANTSSIASVWTESASLFCNGTTKATVRGEDFCTPQKPFFTSLRGQQRPLRIR